MLRAVMIIVALTLTTACYSTGHGFKSDLETLSRLEVGETTPEEAVEILAGEPYLWQNLADGTIVWHWQHVEAGAYVGVTDNRALGLLFEQASDGSWRLKNVLHAQNIELPAGMPFGFVAG